MSARSRATRKRGFTFDDEGLGPRGFKDQSADQVLPRQEGVSITRRRRSEPLEATGVGLGVLKKSKRGREGRERE